MKKLKLNLPAAKVEALTREQLKTIIGGADGEGDCQLLGSPCFGVFNCCNTLKCSADHVCVPWP